MSGVPAFLVEVAVEIGHQKVNRNFPVHTEMREILKRYVKEGFVEDGTILILCVQDKRFFVGRDVAWNKRIRSLKVKYGISSLFFETLQPGDTISPTRSPSPGIRRSASVEAFVRNSPLAAYCHSPRERGVEKSLEEQS